MRSFEKNQTTLKIANNLSFVLKNCIFLKANISVNKNRQFMVTEGEGAQKISKSAQSHL